MDQGGQKPTPALLDRGGPRWVFQYYPTLGHRPGVKFEYKKLSRTMKRIVPLTPGQESFSVGSVYRLKEYDSTYCSI